MHGIIHSELKEYVETKHGSDAWNAILVEAGLEHKMYLPISAYPDEEASAIVGAASKLTKTPAEEILEDFGNFIAPKLIVMYQSLIEPKWKTMELLLNTEETIHRVVRLKNADANPPQLQFEKTGAKELKFNYDSPRRMSAVAKGIKKGVAQHYDETVEIQEKKLADGAREMIIDIE